MRKDRVKTARQLKSSSSITTITRSSRSPSPSPTKRLYAYFFFTQSCRGHRDRHPLSVAKITEKLSFVVCHRHSSGLAPVSIV
ncbi:hypothetical protein QYF36_009482 [Acer negundo]|nr:hypothetical protein QYF36_009482 [Acer negundo]